MTILNSEPGQPQHPAGNNCTFCCAGIASSAGGFEALKGLLGNLPAAENNCCIIVSQVLEDNQINILRNLLPANGYFQLCIARHGDVVQPGKIYANSPGHTIEIANGIISSQPVKKNIDSSPADLLFQSVAMFAGDNSLAVVLSGTGTDGAAGVKSIKAAGGMVLVQMPQTAKYDGMPKAAIDTACADSILNPFEIGNAILAFSAKRSNNTVRLQMETTANNFVSGSLSGVSNLPNKPAKVITMSGQPGAYFEKLVKETLYASYQHMYIVIDIAGAIKEINGNTGLFFNLQNKAAPYNLWDVLNNALHTGVSKIIEKAITQRLLTRSDVEIIELENKLIFVRIIVKPVENTDDNAPLFVVIFENLDPHRFVAKGINITDKMMVGMAMQQLAGGMHTTQ